MADVDEVATPRLGPRLLLFPVDNTEDSQISFAWILENAVRPEDELHLIHVIPHSAIKASPYALPASDYMFGGDAAKAEAAKEKAREFIHKRFLSRLRATMSHNAYVHIIQAGPNDPPVGQVVCDKAEELDASCVMMASHNKSHMQELYVGSVSRHIQHRCHKPVAIFHLQACMLQTFQSEKSDFQS
eukprot:gene3226-13248_t